MNNNLKFQMEKDFCKESNLKGVYSKYVERKEVRKMNTIIGTIGSAFIALIVSVVITNVNIEGNNNMVDNEISKIPSVSIQNEDKIFVNQLGLDNEDIDGRAEDSDLISEYNFLNEIAVLNNLKVTRQFKVYERAFKGQKREDYSLFQENVICYKQEVEEESSIIINFSELELLGECTPIFSSNLKDSTIQNEKVQIFERIISEEDNMVMGKALFNINGVNFKITVNDISHDDFVQIIKSTIIEYKK